MSKRTFIAIQINPTEEMLRRIYYLKMNLIEENINWLREAHLHITLRFIGDTPIEKLNAIEEALKPVLSKYKIFELEVSGVYLFGSKNSPKLIWLGAEPQDKLKELAKEVDTALSPLGFNKDRQNFVPHLSIARIRKLRNKDFFNRVIKSIDKSLIQSERIEKVLFYESILKKSGAEYSILKAFNLGE